MLAAVEAVTSTSQWQLALFNSWSHEEGVGGEGRFGGERQTFIDLPAMSHVHMSNTYGCTLGSRPSTKPINPSRACLWSCLC